MLSFISRHRQSWSSLLCRLASAGYSHDKKVKLNQRGPRGGDSSWSISEAQSFHKVVTYFWNSHETQTTFACSQEKVPREGEVFWMKKHFIHFFFSTKCIVPIITEMQFFKVHTNELCIEISMVSHSNLRSYSKKSIAVRLLAVNVILNFSKQEKQLWVLFKFIESLFKIYLIAGLIQHIIFFSLQTLIQ